MIIRVARGENQTDAARLAAHTLYHMAIVSIVPGSIENSHMKSDLEP